MQNYTDEKYEYQKHAVKSGVHATGSRVVEENEKRQEQKTPVNIQANTERGADFPGSKHVGFSRTNIGGPTVRLRPPIRISLMEGGHTSLFFIVRSIRQGSRNYFPEAPMSEQHAANVWTYSQVQSAVPY